MEEDRARRPKSPASPLGVSERETFSELAQEKTPGLLVEFWGFLRNNKKWWLIPIMIVLSLVGIFVFAATTGAAPFIYPLF